MHQDSKPGASSSERAALCASASPTHAAFPGVASAPGAAPAVLRETVLAQQLSVLFRSWHFKVAAFATALVMMLFLVHASAGTPAVAAIGAAGLLLCLIFAALALRHARRPLRPTPRAMLAAHGLLASAGAVVGGLALVAFPLHRLPSAASMAMHNQEMVFVSIVGGISVAAAITLAPMRIGCTAFIAAALTPTIAQLSAGGASHQLVQAITLAVYFIALVLFVTSAYGTFVERTEAKLDNARLIAELSSASERLANAIDKSPAAIAIFDASDRLVTCNGKFKEIYFPGGADDVQPGVSLESLLRKIAYSPRRAKDTATPEEYIVTRLERHREPGGPWEHQLQDGTWLQSVTGRTPEGGSIVVTTDVTERIQRDLALAEYSKLLQATLDNMDQGLIVLDPDLRIVAANERTGTLLSIPDPLLAYGQPFFEVIRHAAQRGDYGPGDSEEVAKRISMFLQRPEAHSLQRRLPNGTVVEIRGQPMPEGGFVITYTDISERQTVQYALERSEERYRGLVELSQELIMIVRDEAVVFINSAGAALLGARSPQDLVGKPLMELIHPDYQAAARQRIRKMHTSGQPVPTMHQKYVRLDGGIVDVEVTSTPFGDPDGPSVQVVARDITERLRTEEALRESEARFRAVVDNSPTKIHIKDTEGRYLLLNRKSELLFGVTDAEAKGKTTRDVFPQHMSEKFVAHDRAVMETGETIEQEEEFFVDDGLHTFLTVKFPIRDANGRITAIGAIGTDITERKRVDEALRDSEAKLRAIFDNVAQGIHMVDKDLRIVACNQKLLELTEGGAARYRIGGKYEHVVRLNAIRGDYGPGDVEDIVRERMAEVLTGEPNGYERTEPNGRILEVRHSPTQDGGFVTTLTDITDRKRAEEALRESQQILHSVVNAVPAVINVKDRHGRYVFRNHYAREIYSYPEGEELGRTPEEVLGTEYGRRIVRLDRQVIESGKAMPLKELVGPDAQGRERYWLTTKVPLFDTDGTVSHVVTVSLDISKRKEDEQLLRAAKEEAELASRAKSEFLANMSHELRTPLNAIIGFSEILANELMGPIGSPAYRDYANDIHHSGIHLLSLINDILDLSKVEAGKFELQESYIDVVHTLDAAVRIVHERAKNAKVSLSVDVRRNLPMLRADERAVKQMVLNLLSNAVKFTPEGGRVEVRATRDRKGRLLVSVVDSGIGIEAKDIDRVLAPFGQVVSAMTRQHTGTGLGLPLVKSLAELHGAEFILESTPGAGTSATIAFPPDRCRPAASRSNTAASRA